MTPAKSTPSPAATLRLALTRWAARSLSVLSSTWGRWLLLTVAVIVAGYLLYLSVWVPLRQEAILPAGITPTNPELEVTVLQEINAQRAARAQSVRHNFSRYNQLFVPTRGN